MPKKSTFFKPFYSRKILKVMSPASFSGSVFLSLFSDGRFFRAELLFVPVYVPIIPNKDAMTKTSRMELVFVFIEKRKGYV